MKTPAKAPEPVVRERGKGGMESILTLQAYRPSLNASLSAFPALNDGAFEVGMEIFAPFVLFDVEY